MGGLFSAPKVPAPEPSPEPVDTEAEERERRLEMIERRRRGRAGLVTTSSRGLLDENSSNASASQTPLKTKLGE